jgi:hypothetical protein
VNRARRPEQPLSTLRLLASEHPVVYAPAAAIAPWRRLLFVQQPTWGVESGRRDYPSPTKNPGTTVDAGPRIFSWK